MASESREAALAVTRLSGLARPPRALPVNNPREGARRMAMGGRDPRRDQGSSRAAPRRARSVRESRHDSSNVAHGCRVHSVPVHRSTTRIYLYHH